MRRLILLTTTLTVLAAPPLLAGTFDRSSIAPELGLEALTRGVAREQIGRDLFSNPYATVTIGNVDVYDVFPYVEARTFEIVSDPRWNRLVYGEAGRSLRAYRGEGLALGALSAPRGMAVDEFNRVYVADAGNDRILVLQATTEFGEITLSPVSEITGLSRPHGVAYSDGGTPFVAGDDVLYVADTGRNRVAAFALGANGAREIASLGELGSGPGRFAGPLAVAVGRTAGASTRDVYVADAHTQRIVHLRHGAGGFAWVADAVHDAIVVTSLETDQWGNLYASAPNEGVVRKLNAGLAPIAELREAMSRPKGFHVPFFNLHDHRAGTVQRVGRPNALTLDQWTDASGMRLWNLGVEVSDLSLVPDAAASARFMLTDRADVTLELVNASTGRSVARRGAGALEAGVHSLAFTPEDLGAAGAGDFVLRVSAVSSYPEGPTALAQTAIHLDGSGAIASPSQPALLGNTPNPVLFSTRIAFLLPGGSTSGVSLRVFDASGRLVRTFSQGFSPGYNEVIWNGTNDRGTAVSAGVYFSRLDVGPRNFIHKMVFVR